MSPIPVRIVIYAKDVEKITGRSLRTCYMILEKIKKHYRKSRYDFVTVREFCEFLHIDEELVKDYLRD